VLPIPPILAFTVASGLARPLLIFHAVIKRLLVTHNIPFAPGRVHLAFVRFIANRWIDGISSPLWRDPGSPATRGPPRRFLQLPRGPAVQLRVGRQRLVLLDCTAARGLGGLR
jgi:hypothetical protein